MSGSLVQLDFGQGKGVGAVVRLSRLPSVATAIMATGLSDEEIADLLSAELLVKIRTGVVRMWREGAGPPPDDSVIEILASLRPPPPAAARARRVS